MKKVLINSLIVALGLLSCAKNIPYSHEVESKYGLTESTLKHLQFYLVHDVILNSIDDNNSKDTELDENGNIVVKEEVNKDRILIKSGTRGVFVKRMNPNQIAVSFETDDKYLIFGATTQRGKYIIQADEWNPSGEGIVTYGGKKYKLSKTSSVAYVTVKLKKIKKMNASQHIAKGRKV